MDDRRQTGSGPDDQEILNRWRLVLGKYSSEQISFSRNTLQYMDMENVLDFLYSREYGEEQEVREEKRGGSENSQLTVPHWLHQIKKLFPKQTVEILERHALEKYNMTELLTDPDVLRKLEPNKELLKTILELKHMMKGEVLALARDIVRKVADEIARKLEQEVRISFFGKLNRNASSPVRSARNLDVKKTIRMNLKNYDQDNRQLVLKDVYFSSRMKKYNQWRVIICVDESGSMLDSVIHSAIMAGIFAKLPMLDTRLVIFDTNVVDLSGYVEDPVETLMSVQLGGGTNIAGALSYCEGLIDFPYRTMVVLVTDLYEGGGYQRLYSVSRGIIESGARLVVLTALDMEANPSYDRNAAAALADMGAFVGAMTPEQLAEWIGKIVV
ncbi:MAG: VWA domain-containing protein [Lachnospiraceae bacterium]|nr:VWA domain-containing protein [Lachnospiraceae bacterium]